VNISTLTHHQLRTAHKYRGKGRQSVMRNWPSLLKQYFHTRYSFFFTYAIRRATIHAFVELCIKVRMFQFFGLGNFNASIR
jgi:hypothetical protein